MTNVSYLQIADRRRTFVPPSCSDTSAPIASSPCATRLRRWMATTLVA